MPDQPPVIELQLTKEPTEAGKAALLKNGKPVFTVDGQELELDYPGMRTTLSAANHEAQTRRVALEGLAKALGITVDVENEAGLAALSSRLEGYSTEQTELTSLRAAKVAGELDDTTDDKVKALAGTMREKELTELVAQLEAIRLHDGQETVRADTAVRALHESQVVTALGAFYDKAQGFGEGGLATFLSVAQVPQQDGFRWRPTGNVSPEGIPEVALTNDSGITVKGPDGVTPQTLAGWSDSSLKTAHPRLFKVPEGGPPGVTPDTLGGATNTTAEKMPRTALDEATRATYAQTATT